MPRDAVTIHDNFIHHNQHDGGNGYGVDVSNGGWAVIEHNLFDVNRHALRSRHGTVPRGTTHSVGWPVTSAMSS